MAPRRAVSDHRDDQEAARWLSATPSPSFLPTSTPASPRQTSAQAASAGTPVVSTNTIPFSIHHAAEEALLFEPGDKDGLVDALKQLLSDPAEHARRGQEIEKTLEELDWTMRVGDFLAYLNRRGFEISPGRTA